MKLAYLSLNAEKIFGKKIRNLLNIYIILEITSIFTII